MKKGFYPVLIAFLVLSGLILCAPAAQAYEGNCVCAGCDRPCGSGHASNCPYAPGGGTGGGGGGGGGGGSIERAPIFVAPVGMACGVFGGGIWYFKQMAGSFKKDMFLDSYNKFLKADPSDEWAADAFTFGLRMGGIPWLALYVPTGPIRYGVSSVYKAATKPSPPKPKPIDPNIAVYDLIARNYSDLARFNDVELKKAQGTVEAAKMRCTKMLDTFIAENQELRALKEKEGVNAARLKAVKLLDVYSKARAEKKKLALTLAQDIRMKQAEIDEAIKNANPASFFVDYKLARHEMSLDNALKDETLPQGVKDSLNRELKYTKLVQNGKFAYDAGKNAVEIVQSYNKAAAEGKDATQWLEDREAREKIWRLQLKCLSKPLSGWAGIGVGAAETAMDTAYAITASVKLGGVIDDEIATLERLRTAQTGHDALADDWDELNNKVMAAEVSEATIRSRGDQYRKMQKENENNAQRLRVLGRQFK